MKRWIAVISAQKRWIALFVGVFVSLFFLYFGFQGMNLGEVVQVIKTADFIWIVPGVAVYFLGVWGRTWRWHYLLRPMKDIPLSRLFPITVIGYMGNNIYPFRAGEVIRAFILYRNEGITISASLGTIVVERVFDGLVMLIFVFVALPFAPIPPDLRSIVVGGTFLFFTALAVFLVMAVRPVMARRVYKSLFGFLPKRIGTPLIRYADQFMEGLQALRSPRDLAMILVASCFIWLCETTKYWFVLHAFPALSNEPQITFFVLMIMTAIVNLATTVPSAPGYIGTFDAPGIRVLESFGAIPEQAAAYTLVLHAALWLPITALGVYYLIREGLSWRSFGEATQAVNAEKQTKPEGTV